MNKRIMENKELINKLVESMSDEVRDIAVADGVNSYAACLGLTYPDKQHQLYYPGEISKLTESIEFSQTNTECGAKNANGSIPDYAFIAKCFQNDADALGLKYEKISVDQIDDDPNYYYVSLADLTTLPDNSDHHPYFMFRPYSGLWLHKPSWSDGIRLVCSQKYTESFDFVGNPEDFNISNCEKVKCYVSCFPEHIYRIELQ